MAAQVNEEEKDTRKMTVFVAVPRPRDPCPDYRAPVALKLVPLEVSSDHTVASVKSTLHGMVGIPPRRQRLVFARSALPDDDGTTLADHGVVDSATIQLVETEMQVFVRYVRNITISDVESSDTVESFRLRVQKLVGAELRPEKQRLIYSGKQMEDGHTLAEYGVRDCTGMDLVYRWTGRMRTRVVELEIEVTDTVGKIKERVEEAEGVPVACQSRVYYQDKDLDDDHALAVDGHALLWLDIECKREEDGDAASKTLNKADALPVRRKTVKRHADLEVAGPAKKVKKKMKQKPPAEVPTVERRHFRVFLLGPELAAICPSSCDMDPAT